MKNHLCLSCLPVNFFCNVYAKKVFVLILDYYNVLSVEQSCKQTVLKVQIVQSTAARVLSGASPNDFVTL